MTGTDIDWMFRYRVGRDDLVKRFSNADPSRLSEPEKTEVLRQIRTHNFGEE